MAVLPEAAKKFPSFDAFTEERIRDLAGAILLEMMLTARQPEVDEYIDRVGWETVDSVSDVWLLSYLHDLLRLYLEGRQA